MSTAIILRPWQTNDLDSLVLHANNFHVSRYMTNMFPFPYTRAHGEKFIVFANQDDPIHIFAIEVSGEAVGGIGIHPQADILCKNAELGYWIGEACWGKGIATEAVKQIVPFAFRTFDITRIFARPFGNNPASARVLEKAGFVLEARLKDTIYKNGEYLDELIYAVRKEYS
ncbi:MAG TPA: GNAT family protein [Phnomibacter sp.]|nr:GNAT family protein [Phnomibacter sp.]